MKKILLILTFATFSLGVIAQHDHPKEGGGKKAKTQKAPEFKDKKLGQAYSQYLMLKVALVASDADKVATQATELRKALSELPKAKKAQASASSIMNARALKAQREAFSELSTYMTALVKKAELRSGSVYLKFCPMANAGKGAHWLANKEEINNPYFGERMLRCGTVKETLQ